MAYRHTTFGTLAVAALLSTGGCGDNGVAAVRPLPHEPTTTTATTPPPASAPTPTAPDPRIVGEWSLEEGDDYLLVDEYRADGTLVQHVFGKTTAPTPFRIEGNFIVYPT